MNTQEHISQWLRDYALDADKDGYCIGVSGGIDSACVSTLCALTDLQTICLVMPIHQNPDHTKRGLNHVKWLMERHDNVLLLDIPLDHVCETFLKCLPPDTSDLALANSKARLRMTTLYAVATTRNSLVAGTGNYIEDFCLGFYTKWGDGAVDVNPIGSLTKTEVWQLGKDLGINKEIIEAPPSDGLWLDSRSDEDQIGASYSELERVAKLHKEMGTENLKKGLNNDGFPGRLGEVVKIYLDFYLKNKHKMESIPVCPHI